MSDILREILDQKRVEVSRRLSETPWMEMKYQAFDAPIPPPFAAALRAGSPGLIAEVKRRSPSAGLIRDNFRPDEIAISYATAGAQAVSVLMDEKFFGGGEEDFNEVRSAVKLPLLYKEFVVDPWQIAHARLIGASAVLLIAAALDDRQLREFSDCAAEFGLEVLLEVHEAAELERAITCGAKLIGVNNRNLRTFETRLETTLDLLPQMPEEVTVVSESGIRSAEDVRRLQKAGARAVLVGEHLLRQEDLIRAVQDLLTP